MVHLTNDYRKLLRRNGPKAALSLCVALALSGSLVSAQGKTYDYVNQWGVREALEGDPIEVKWMGSGDVTLQAGTDETGEVIVHSLATSGNPDVYVKGKKITIGDNYPSSDPTKTEPVRTANWGGTISIGDDTTESVNMEGFCTSGQNSDTNIRGGSISLGSLDNWGGTVTINTDGDFKVAKDNVAADVNVTGNRVETNQGTIYYGGTLSVTAGSVEAGGLGVTGNYEGKESKAEFHIGGASGIHFHDGLSANTNGNILIDSRKIQVDGHSGDGCSIHTTDSTISMGNDGAEITLNGLVFNAGSAVTLKGKSILINAAQPDSTDGRYNFALKTTNGAKSNTVIGDEDTDTVHINGKTNVSSIGSSLKIQGRHIEMAYGKGVALSGYGGHIYVGGSNTENLTVTGQVSNQSSEDLNLSGEHITVDSTGYDGPESTQFPFSESLVTPQNNIDAGDKNTKTIFISSGLNALNGNINVMGKEIAIGASHYFNTHKISDALQDGFIANAANGKVNIGSEESELVHLYDGQLFAGGADINILGKNISVASSTDYITPDKDGSVNMIHAKGGNVRIGSENSDTVALSGGKLFADGKDITVKGKNISVASSADYITPDKDGSVTMVHAAGGNVNIGSENSDTVALSGGRLLADGKDITIQGHHISLDGKQQWAGQTNGGKLTIGSQNSDSISIHGKGGIYALGGAVDVLGKHISIQSDADKALMNNGAPIIIGGPDTESIHVSGGIVSHGSQISLQGRDVSISKGKQENAIHTDGGTVSITATGGEDAHISGPVRNDKGTIEISLSDKASHLDSQVITKNGGTTNISLFDKASWNPAGDTSNFITYTGNDGIIHLDNNTHQTVTISNFNDADTRIHEDIYGSKNTGNDTIHIDNTYTGHTHFWLVNREGTDKGVVGTVLASALKKDAVSTGNASGAKALMMMAAKPMAAPASNPIADFQADHFKAFGMNSLYFKTYGLGVKDSEGDTADYTKDLYITGVTNHTTNDKGQYTPTVSTALSGSSLMYYTWRTENDKMLQRVGDLRENEGEETGLWARIRGSRIGKSHSDRGFKNQYKVYEIGYDAKTEDNDRMKSFTGIAFSYLDGKGYYADGRGTNQAASAAIYHTDIHKTGHYLDLVFRIRHMNERLHTHTTVDTDIGPITEDHSASMDTTGLSFSAEYGRKKFVGNGWYVEPQTQWTLGYLGPNQYEMDNGTRVEQPGITSFVGRVGFNLGRHVNPNSIVYLKANVYHEFGGHSPIHLYAGDESLSFTDTFDDTWFEYGVGFAMKLGSRLSLYGDFEKSAGSHFYKDWQWNAGIRYSF